jgi:hypothetical protein
MRGRLAALGAVLGVLVATSAQAANIIGTPRGEIALGTRASDFMDPGSGRDRIVAGRGNDRIKSFDSFRDVIRCGPGRDVVAADLVDLVNRDCETVSRRIAQDPYRDALGQHRSIVEPDSYAFGSTIVSVYQAGRIRNGGASNIGFATSRNGGRTWRSGGLPALTVNATPRGRWARASDPVIGYDAAHGVWLASTLALNSGEESSALAFSRSRDGLTWSAPVLATTDRGDLGLDKQWFTCDNWPSSPFYGSCYLAYSDLRVNRISVQFSRDGGLTWSPPIGAPDNAGRRVLNVSSPGVQPVVRPNGDVLVLFYDVDRMSSIRSTDGGQSFSSTQFVARAEGSAVNRFRAFSLPVADVDSAGTVYLAWQDCSFRAGECDGGDLALSRSADGINWTQTARIPLGPQGNLRYYALPGLAADPTRPGRLGLAYYRLEPGGAIDAFFASSTNRGASWSAPRRLSPQSMTRAWIAPTTLGPMIGDYISTSYVAGRPIAVVVYAARPRAGQLDESLFAAFP